MHKEPIESLKFKGYCLDIQVMYLDVQVYTEIMLPRRN